MYCQRLEMENFAICENARFSEDRSFYIYIYINNDDGGNIILSVSMDPLIWI